MRNRELVKKRIDQVDNSINSMKFMLSRNTPKNEFESYLDKAKAEVEDLKSLIEREPFGPNEMNKT